MSKNINTDDKQHLDSVNQFLSTNAQWIPLHTSASTNRHFQALVDDKSLILRLNAANTLAFGVSRKAEACILELIEAYHWSPQIINNNWQEGWCLMLDHGTPIDTEKSPSVHQEVVSTLLSAVHEWQTIQLDKSLNDACAFNYQGLFEKYRRAFKTSQNDAILQDNLRLTDEVEKQVNTLPSVPNCLVHHDLHQGNICKKDDQFVVLDWEYAGFGNPWFDAAALHSQFGISDKEIASLPAFKHLNNIKLSQGITDAVKLTNTLEALWLAVRKSSLKK